MAYRTPFMVTWDLGIVYYCFNHIIVSIFCHVVNHLQVGVIELCGRCH